MSFSKRIAIVFVRPVYRALFEKPIWWFLARVKAFFFAEIGIQLGNMEQHLGRDAAVQDQRFSILEERLRMVEANIAAQNAAQWDAMEQVLLAMFRQTGGQTDSSRTLGSQLPHQDAKLDRVNAASNLR